MKEWEIEEEDSVKRLKEFAWLSGNEMVKKDIVILFKLWRAIIKKM